MTNARRANQATEDPAPGSCIPIDSAPNLRDLGGWEVRGGGRVRRRAVFRSAQLGGLQDEDVNAFARLGIRTVYDLRTETERSRRPDRLPDDIRLVPTNVLGEGDDASPGHALEKLSALADMLVEMRAANPRALLDLLKSPKAGAAALLGGRATRLAQSAYRQLVTLQSAQTAYREMFAGFADPDNHPALFHCTSGKDRTGWGAAAILLFLGVSDDDVMSDYLLTNRDLLPTMQPVLERAAAAGVDPELLVPVLGVRGDYLEAAVDEMVSAFGSIQGYFERGLCLDEHTMSALHAGLTHEG